MRSGRAWAPEVASTSGISRPADREDQYSE